MKKLFYLSIITILCLVFNTEIFAQYSIPTFDVPVDPHTTFIMGDTDNKSAEEIKLKIDITDNKRSPAIQWAIIEYYTTDGSFTSTPCLIYEGNIAEFTLDSDKTYGVRVLSNSSNAKISVWTETIISE